jgi:hypothetical protein
MSTNVRQLPMWLRLVSYVPLAVVVFDVVRGAPAAKTLLHFVGALVFVALAIVAAIIHSAWVRGREQQRRVKQAGGK